MDGPARGGGGKGENNPLNDPKHFFEGILICIFETTNAIEQSKLPRFGCSLNAVSKGVRPADLCQQINLLQAQLGLLPFFIRCMYRRWTP